MFSEILKRSAFTNFVKYSMHSFRVPLVLKSHPSNRTKDNNGHEDDSQDASQGHNGSGVGRSSNRGDNAVHRTDQVDSDHYTNHNADESCYVHLNLNLLTNNQMAMNIDQPLGNILFYLCFL